ncbi:MAG TPA: tetratricopeptide repeat protein [Actinomycetota bacterium]|nr:tetratricopeptide repeat protein [Actinomycetota bacterium]
MTSQPPPRRGKPRHGGRGGRDEPGRVSDLGPHQQRRKAHGNRGLERRDRGREPAHLSDDVTKELRATARPGKGDLLVKVFADAAAAYLDEDYPEAIRLGEQAKHMALRAAVPRELLGLAYYRAGRWQEAARELSAFRRLSGSPEQNPTLADCYRALGKPERAVELCEEVTPANVAPETYYEANIVAAGALADQDRLDEAIARLESLELQPENAEEHHLRAWYALADLLERRGRFTQAREWFEAVAAADPDATDAPQRARRARLR